MLLSPLLTHKRIITEDMVCCTTDKKKSRGCVGQKARVIIHVCLVAILLKVYTRMFVSDTFCLNIREEASLSKAFMNIDIYGEEDHE